MSFFESSDDFESKFMKRIREIMKEMDKAVKNGKSTGRWKVSQIDRPDVKGYIIQGRFGPDRNSEALNPLNPLEPRDPNERRPTPKRRFNVSKEDWEQERETLIDVFEEEDSVKIYIEMPDENEKDIQLNITEDKVEVKGKKSSKTVDLPTKQIDTEKTSSKYKNGVFQLSIPKTEE